jgi:hypothetical protein
VGGGDDPHVDRGLGLFSDAEDAAFLHHAEQFGLERGFQFSDLVEEKHSPVGGPDEARTRALRTREGAAPVPEEFALGEGGDEGAAVYRDKGRAGATRITRVERPGDAFLAGAGLPGDKYGQVAQRGEAEHLAEDVEHRRPAAFDPECGEPLAKRAFFGEPPEQGPECFAQCGGKEMNKGRGVGVEEPAGPGDQRPAFAAQGPVVRAFPVGDDDLARGVSVPDLGQHAVVVCGRYGHEHRMRRGDRVCRQAAGAQGGDHRPDALRSG